MVSSSHIIDLDILSSICTYEPCYPGIDLLVYQHKPMGQLVWDPCRIYLLLSLGQMSFGNISGHRAREELAHERVLNANLLDYLVHNQHLIPENWKRYEVYFWGTIYKVNNLKSPNSFVRCLVWENGKWDWEEGWYWKEGRWKSWYLDLDSGWTHLRRAAVLIDI